MLTVVDQVYDPDTRDSRFPLMAKRSGTIHPNGDITVGDKAIAFREIGDGLVALVLMDVRTPTVPVPKEVRLVPSASVDSELDLAEALQKWDAIDGPAVSGVHLRALNLGAVTRDYVANVQRVRKVQDDLGFDPEILIQLDLEQGKAWGFKRAADFRAAVTRASAAMVYVGAASQGEAKPVVVVANELFDGDVARARSSLAQARKKGYLLGGKPGRVGGEISDDALNLVKFFNRLARSEDGASNDKQ